MQTRLGTQGFFFKRRWEFTQSSTLQILPPVCLRDAAVASLSILHSSPRSLGRGYRPLTCPPASHDGQAGHLCLPLLNEATKSHSSYLCGSSSSSLGERHGHVPGGALQTEERLPASLPSWTALRSPQQPGCHIPSRLKAPPPEPPQWLRDAPPPPAGGAETGPARRECARLHSEQRRGNNLAVHSLSISRYGWLQALITAAGAQRRRQEATAWDTEEMLLSAGSGLRLEVSGDGAEDTTPLKRDVPNTNG